MSTKKSSPSRGRTKAQQRDAHQLARTGRAAIEAFQRLVDDDCAKALATLDRIENALDAGPTAPAWFEEYRQAIELVYETGPAPADLAAAAPAIATARELIEGEYTHRFDLMQVAVSALMARVTGADDPHRAKSDGDPFEDAIERLRESADLEGHADDMAIAQAIRRAIDASLGGRARPAAPVETIVSAQRAALANVVDLVAFKRARNPR